MAAKTKAPRSAYSLSIAYHVSKPNPRSTDVKTYEEDISDLKDEILALMYKYDATALSQIDSITIYHEWPREDEGSGGVSSAPED